MKRLFTLLLAGCIGAAASTQAQAQVPIFKNATKIAECLTKAGVSSLLTNGNQAFDKRFRHHAATNRPPRVSPTPRPLPRPISSWNVEVEKIATSGIVRPDLHKKIKRLAQTASQTAKRKPITGVSSERMLDRFLRYARTESPSVETPNYEDWALSEGQRIMAKQIADEVRSFGGNAEVTLSDEAYVYIKLPSNLNKRLDEQTPVILLTAHSDITPEAPSKGINPLVWKDYAGTDLTLSPGIVLSTRSKEGKELPAYKGKTIITSDGKTILGADCKCGVTILVSLLEELIKNPHLKHGEVQVVISTNEDVGKAAHKWEAERVFGKKPDIVLDCDGEGMEELAVENFTAIAQTFTFRGNKVHPGHGKQAGMADATTAAAYFLGQIPPAFHPGETSGKDGYLHAYALQHPTDSLGQPNLADTELRFRLRYFRQANGDSLRQALQKAERLTLKAYPNVRIEKTAEALQYANVAYSMWPDTEKVVLEAARKRGTTLRPQAVRGGTTAAMIATKGMPGGASMPSGQHNPHSVYEWTCLEEMMQIKNILGQIILDIRGYNTEKPH